MPAAGTSLFPIVLTIFFVDLHRRMGKLVPRRIYTEILTNDEADGEYIRSTLRVKTPNLWSFLSK